MNLMNCAQVREQLDLLAAGACDAPTQAALERHLLDCPDCAARYAESRRLLGLLDLHFGAAGMERVRQRIEREARPVLRRPRLFAQRGFTPVLRRAVAAAAVFLLVAGLLCRLPDWDG